jgi:hypothetical protein
LADRKATNPKTRRELEAEEAIRRFLGGEAPPSAALS